MKKGWVRFFVTNAHLGLIVSMFNTETVVAFKPVNSRVDNIYVRYLASLVLAKFKSLAAGEIVPKTQREARRNLRRHLEEEGAPSWS